MIELPTAAFVVVCPYDRSQMAGSSLVGEGGRDAVGRAVLALQSGSHASCCEVPRESFMRAVETLGQEQKAWLDRAAVECQRRR